jgi:hypothetical protein
VITEKKIMVKTEYVDLIVKKQKLNVEIKFLKIEKNAITEQVTE